MSCCGGASAKRCALCSMTSKKWFPWGAKRKICWRCKEKQEELIKLRENLNKRAKTLLSGKEFK